MKLLAHAALVTAAELPSAAALLRALAPALAAALLVAVAGCEREARRFDKVARMPDPLVEAASDATLQPGQPGRGLREFAVTGFYDESSAYEVAQGRRWYRWFNCAGCHAQGGGAIGPALMDDQWLYGRTPDEIFATIMDGRPNGMPSFRGRIPEGQARQIVAYVRSMSGLVSNDVAPNRTDGIAAAPPENRREPTPPWQRK